MRFILALSLLIPLYGVANAEPVHHSHRHAVVRSHQGVFAPSSASSFAYVPPRPATEYRSAPSYGDNEPYFGASQGYAPGEKERFLHSLFGP
ncbi:hypothetical protein [Bradyrhizobium sp. cf659]|uniref:hypothetical protein n=1 Tax=Bradyrhizobium sp. cf659 TaxID=1761771 RepID=UPI0008EC0597|nr:hypothetical protein [Bradyrhizobium sp. cf659]SFJ12399.1 hypothetical protein SAMN04487925_105155 [Bradyrhizobium sp. cf659]